MKVIKIFSIIFLFIIFYIIYKNKNKIIGKYRWLKRKSKREINYLRRKYYTQENDIKKLAIALLGIFLYSIIILVFLSVVGIIDVCENDNTLIFDFKKINIKEHCYEFLWAQISASLIVSTVISLLSIFSETYIYGKKIINVIFNKNSIFSLGKMFVYLVILNFISLAFCLKQVDYHIILISFVISISLVFYMLFKIMIFYTHPFFYRSCVKSDYIKRERKHIKKAKPLDAHTDLEIINLKEVTMALIQKNDNDYNININAIMEMIETSLINNSKDTQEYYTEIVNRTDFISSILEIISHLIKHNKFNEANNLMGGLYNRLRFYRVVLIKDYLAHVNIKALINNGKYIENEIEAQEYFRILWDIINNEIYFVYLYCCELDLSYCRLGKLGEDYIHFLTYNNFLESVYLCIRENKHLSLVEKERIFDQLYDNIRMMELKEDFPDPDIRHYLKNELNENKIKIPLIIKGEPIVLMLLKMFELEDTNNLYRYRTMNVSEELMYYLVSLTTLALLEFLNKNCQRKFVNDLDLTKSQIINVYTKTDFHNIQIAVDNLKDLYNLFVENYIKGPRKRAYFLLPRLRLSLEVINNYFYYLFKKINKEKEFYKLIKRKKFVPSSDIINIIKELKI